MPIERTSVVTKLRPRNKQYKALPEVPQAQAESISQRVQSKKSIDVKPTSSSSGSSHNKSWQAEYQDTATLYIDAVLKLAKLELDDRSPSQHDGDVRSMVIDKAILLNSNRITSPSQPWVSQRLVISVESSAGSSASMVEADEEPPASKGVQSVVVRCNAWTKSGLQCKRNVRSSPGLAVEGAATEVFCYQHRTRLLQPTGFYASKGSEWVSFSDWIPSYLHPETQAALRVEMAKLPSPADSPGHIYVFEIRDRSSDRLRLKVGRAINVVQRIDQWDRQCRTHEHVLRGWYPESDNQSKSKSPSHLKGLVKVGDPAAWCHRLERLIHLELADLATRSAYLDPGWPVVAPLPTSTQRSSVVQCSDCGESHREIFDFVRVKQGKYRNREWEMIVLPVIRKWGQFTAKYL
ncbi:hypothetical protein BDN71DRAFT_1439440 [Pleurotus eryngii]|uniref:DUF1766-domain-containing protein n=1 Tax=Pleurotus eryngii TaxID=5323 RepID=A0A9P6A737_PLEER|nr:hypothetical protein BDN71DRAFT_1439440 [Pleurotus eryngii]